MLAYAREHICMVCGHNCQMLIKWENMCTYLIYSILFSSVTSISLPLGFKSFSVICIWWIRGNILRCSTLELEWGRTYIFVNRKSLHIHVLVQNCVIYVRFLLSWIKYTTVLYNRQSDFNKRPMGLNALTWIQ